MPVTNSWHCDWPAKGKKKLISELNYECKRASTLSVYPVCSIFTFRFLCGKHLHIKWALAAGNHLITKLWTVQNNFSLFWKSKCGLQILLIKCWSSHLLSFFFFFFLTVEPCRPQWWKWDMWGGYFKLQVCNLLKCYSHLTLLYSVLSVNIKCICHCRVSDTPGIPWLNCLKTHFRTNIVSALSLSQIASLHTRNFLERS